MNFLKKEDFYSYKVFILISLVDRLVNDFLHYTYFGLNSIAPMHNQVAYTLFRKPFQENLCYIEQLLVDPDKFLNEFCSDNPDIKN